MQPAPRPRPGQSRPKPSRTQSWARLWLACIATVLTCAAHLLPRAHQRRLPLLNLPTRVLAQIVARLIFLCAVENATAPANLRNSQRQTGVLRALLRAGVQRHLTNAHGALDLDRIVRTCANPDAAIADMIAALETGLTCRNQILPRAACDASATLAPDGITCACDTS